MIQENRDKRIEEIASVLMAKCDSEVDCSKKADCDMCRAEHLYEKGYRKADEVALEVIDEFEKIVLASIKKDEAFREQMHTDTDRSYFEGGANSVRKLKWYIEELKKKYTTRKEK